MPLLKESDRTEVAKIFEALSEPVRIINFTQSFECDGCSDAHQLMEEVASLSDKLTLEVFDFAKDTQKVAEYGVTRIPATVLAGDRDYGIRFYGVPGGYEFSSLLESILMVSKRASGLSEKLREKVASIDKPVHLQVLVTPT